MKRNFASLLLLALATGAAFVGGAATAEAQVASHPNAGDAEVPPPPAGNAVVRGTVSDPGQPGATAGLDVALYALRADGRPGIGRAKTDATGAFAFESISGATDIVYLVGVRYAGVPYGQRVTFQPGQSAIDIAIEVARPIEDGKGLRVTSSELLLEWRGSRVVVSEEHTVSNPGRAAVYVEAARRAALAPPLAFALPAGYEGFQAPLGTGDEGFTRAGEALSYWGPIYPGEQTIRFGYLLPAGATGAPVAFRKAFPRGTGTFRVLSRVPGPRVSSQDLLPPRTVEIDGAPHEILETGALAAGESVALAVALPETTRDLDAIRIASSEVTVELDDTVLTVTQMHRLVVAPGAIVAGAPDAPLLRFLLPGDADLEGLSADAAGLGIGATPEGIDVLGPLGEGTHEFAYRYRIPAPGAQAQLDLRFPLRVPTLSVTVADTGLRIEAPRLHRLRPRQMGTRTWLLREAFHVEPDEKVSMRFIAATQKPVPATASLAIVLGLGVLVLVFVVRPLRKTPGAAEDPALASVSQERDLVYATIRDLDHDHETGKVADEDYERTRAELREQAIALLRLERTAPVQEVAASEPSGAANARGFCPQCGTAVAGDWSFCSACGGKLPDAPSRSTLRTAP